MIGTGHTSQPPLVPLTISDEERAERLSEIARAWSETEATLQADDWTSGAALERVSVAAADLRYMVERAVAGNGAIVLRDCSLTDVDLSSCAIELPLYMSRCHFSGTVTFEKATFRKDARFQDSVFSDRASFSDATFAEGASFSRSTFGDDVNFSGTMFGDAAYFSGITFGDRADFACAIFHSFAYFGGGTFGHQASFFEADFSDRTNFAIVRFGNEATFKKASFGDEAHFLGWFGDGASFERATFGYRPDFMGVAFGDGAVFSGAMFGDEARFSLAKFGAIAKFDYTTFGDDANFRGATFGEEADFRRLTVGVGAAFDGARMPAAVFCGADLRTASLTDAFLERANLRELKCSRAEKMRLLQRNLEPTLFPRSLRLFFHAVAARPESTALGNAIVSRLINEPVQGPPIHPDGTNLHLARLDPRSEDRWSILRRTYTGPALFLNLLAIAVFVGAYALKATLWRGLNVIQAYAGRVVDMSQMEEWRIIWVLFSFDQWSRSPWLPILAMALVAYNIIRFWLTRHVGGLREEEDRSGFSPYLHEYRLSWHAHRFAQVLAWAAVIALAVHGYRFATQTVRLDPEGWRAIIRHASDP